ncbi:MAG: YiiX/YebB-like N1pC/P60 family cysteine hydrolase [Bdellovibrionales bacterium]|jgi:hypothetical protein|nr:YiiX/YebB-like N1pC/P60 family cysteine hydrolase [Bdellovibrionales bacterium]
MILTWFRASCFAAIFALAFATVSGAQGRELSALENLSARGGVEPQAFQRFFDAVSKTVSGTTANADELDDLGSVACFERFDDTDGRRTEAIECLTAYGAQGLHGALFDRLIEIHIPRMSRLPTEEMLKSLALLNYLEDLVRARLTLNGKQAHWYVPGAGFLASGSKEEFDFQDGDVVLGLGNSSISSLISQVTNPPGRYSHAFIVRVRDGKPTTVESLIETGVEEFPWSHFQKDKYNTLTVIRWKDATTRAAVTRRASDAAYEFAQKKIGYDTAIDLDSDKKMFCTELIVKAYMDASGETQSRILPHKAVVRSEPAFQHIQNLGVMNRTFVAPGDLLNSDLFEVVGEYRRTEDLFKSWKIFLMGDVFLDRIEDGYVVHPGLFYSVLPLAAWIVQILPSIFHEDLRLLPKSFGPGSFAVTATVEKSIYERIFKAVDAEHEQNLLKTGLWEYRDSLKKALKKNWFMKQPRPSEDNFYGGG